MTVALASIAGVLLLAGVIWIGTHLVAHPEPGGGAMVDAFGSGLSVFDPGKARADEELDQHGHLMEIIPSPDDEDHPVWKVDLQRNSVRIPRSR
ncbi:hypothetical protein [Nocardioides mangrovi]|uniref:Uncharacterized protein n=1 Tax=Nocardioides mangrovi TaxID=2874580 RepID=A0ABS7U7V5_9ACTN|nr:hypothetical protein [Nocardioides mangrovi]MBZ5737050.1 hypothetical protein [Nocardioides mangrovi]